MAQKLPDTNEGHQSRAPCITPGTHRRKQRRLRMTVPLIASMAAVALGLSACGSGSASLGVAHLGSTTSTQAPSSAATGIGANSSKYRAALAYVSCMRSHGVANFPDPSSNGMLNDDFASGGKGGPISSGINRNSPQFIQASTVCRHLLPGGIPTAAQNQLALTKGLKFARCMRGHGVANYPDPTTAGVVHLGAGVDPSSPEFQNARTLCQTLVPGEGSK